VFLQDISGVHDASMAKNVPGVRSGVGYRVLQEKDEARLAPKLRRRRRFWQRAGYLMIRTLAQFAREDRIAKVLGEDDSWEAVRWSGKNLRGDSKGAGASYFDVRIRTTGTLTSKVAQMESLQALVQNGFLNPQDERHTKMVFEMLDFGHLRGGVDPTRDDRQRQRFENDLMMKGNQIPVSSYEDHEVHQQEIDRFRKKAFFKVYPPEVQAIFEAHWQEHERAKMQIAMQAQLTMQAEGQRMLATSGQAAGGGADAGGAPAMGGRMGMNGNGRNGMAA
jgi:hypothetical protein